MCLENSWASATRLLRSRGPESFNRTGVGTERVDEGMEERERIQERVVLRGGTRRRTSMEPEFTSHWQFCERQTKTLREPVDESPSRKRPRFWPQADTEDERIHEKGVGYGQNKESLGPISYLVVEFPGSEMTREALPILVDLVNDGVIRILDLVFVTKAKMVRWALSPSLIWTTTGRSTSQSSKGCPRVGQPGGPCRRGTSDHDRVVCRHTFRGPVGQVFCRGPASW